MYTRGWVYGIEDLKPLICISEALEPIHKGTGTQGLYLALLLIPHFKSKVLGR